MHEDLFLFILVIFRLSVCICFFLTSDKFGDIYHNILKLCILFHGPSKMTHCKRIKYIVSWPSMMTHCKHVKYIVSWPSMMTHCKHVKYIVSWPSMMTHCKYLSNMSGFIATRSY